MCDFLAELTYPLRYAKRKRTKHTQYTWFYDY